MVKAKPAIDEEQPPHPHKTGRTKLTPGWQWARVEEWHAFCESDGAANYPIIDGLNSQWGECGDPLVERGKDLRRLAGGTPLATLFYLVGVGFYPPPELLLALKDCWSAYMDGCGKLSLEDAFIGPLKKGVGNYASRDERKDKKLMIQCNFRTLLGHGATRTQAAEGISAALGGKPDAESILRMCRGVRPWAPPQVGVPEK